MKMRGPDFNEVRAEAVAGVEEDEERGKSEGGDDETEEIES